MESLKPESQKELQELLLLYDSLLQEVEDNGNEMNKETAQRLYNIYDAISNLLKDNL